MPLLNMMQCILSTVLIMGTAAFPNQVNGPNTPETAPRGSEMLDSGTGASRSPVLYYVGQGPAKTGGTDMVSASSLSTPFYDSSAENPALGGTPDYSARTAENCMTMCGLASTDVVGFSWYDNDDSKGASDGDQCFCITSANDDDIYGLDETAGNYDRYYTYCYECMEAELAPSSQPSSAPSGQPSSEPSSEPSSQPSGQPSAQPSGQPSSMPSGSPSGQPSSAPSGQPSSMPSGQPSSAPSGQPSTTPSSQPSGEPSSQPSGQPSSHPSSQPSSQPSESPSGQPSSAPSGQPSSMPSESPSSQPSTQPSSQPSSQPSESPSANPSQGCDNIRTDCGWGIFNPWTCRCDCPVGICLDNNEQCYTPCRDTIHTNPWGGCSPGWDCPWFPSAEDGHCRSELHQPNNFEIYRTAKECCDEHYPRSSSCLEDSKNSHDPFPWPIHFPGTPEHRSFAPPEAENHWGTEASHSGHWFPDLIGKLNCVYGSNYENWMQEDGFEESYLFSNSEDCCEKWYPTRSDCPDIQRATNPEAEDEPWHSAPYSMQNYYFPDFSKNSCGFGWDYPAWMGINGYEKSYLFREGDECCSRYFPTVSNCPYENTQQTDYYWTSYEDNIYNLDDMPIIYNHTYYPDIEARTCVNGTDFPEWMNSDTDFTRLYIFKNLEGCCKHWFTDFGVDGCINNVIQGKYTETPCPENREGDDENDPGCHQSVISNVTAYRLTMWYPDLDAYRCKNDGAMPSWMTSDGYSEWYLYNTNEQCCAAFGYC